MLIEFYDKPVPTKQVIFGSVVFVTDISDKDNVELYKPAHVSGFAQSDFGEVLILVDCMGNEDTYHPNNLVWNC